MRAPPRAATAAFLVAAALLAGGGQAEAAPPGWLSQHAIFELTGGPSWRVALALDPKAPGFQAGTVGAELILGADVAAGLGVVVEGRARYGSGPGGDYGEFTAGLGAQYRPLDRLRARLLGEIGPALGRGGVETVWLAGGALAVSLDVVPLGAHGALSLALRIDVGAFVDPPPGFPAVSLGLGAGFGGRY